MVRHTKKKAAKATAASGSDVRAMELTPLPDTTPTSAENLQKARGC
jgi:hypothetical protein